MNRGVPLTKVTDKNICEHLSGTNFVSPDRRRPNGAVPLHQHNFTIFLNWAFTQGAAKPSYSFPASHATLSPPQHSSQGSLLIVNQKKRTLRTRFVTSHGNVHRNVCFPRVKCISFSSLSFWWISYPQRANHGI